MALSKKQQEVLASQKAQLAGKTSKTAAAKKPTATSTKPPPPNSRLVTPASIEWGKQTAQPAKPPTTAAPFGVLGAPAKKEANFKLGGVNYTGNDAKIAQGLYERAKAQGISSGQVTGLIANVIAGARADRESGARRTNDYYFSPQSPNDPLKGIDATTMKGSIPEQPKVGGGTTASEGAVNYSEQQNIQAGTSGVKSAPVGEGATGTSGFGPGAQSGLTPQEPEVAPQNVSAEELATPAAAQEQAAYNTEGMGTNSSDNFFAGLGAHKKYVQSRIADFENKTGKKVFTQSTEFQKLFKDHLRNQNDWDAIFKRFALNPEQVPPEPQSTIPVSSTGAKRNTVVQPDEGVTYEDNEPIPTKQTNRDILNNEAKRTVDDLYQEILNLPEDTSSATLIKKVFELNMAAIDDPSVSQYLDTMETRATEAYKDGVAKGQLGLQEIDRAMDGLLGTPTTQEGLMAKVYQQGEQAQLDQIQAAEDYTKAKSDLMLQDMRNKRADLEGYAKAKLYSMGAQDSSAGITLVAKILNEADLNIANAQLDSNYQLTQLDLQAKGIISDYTNNVAKLVLDTNQAEDTMAAQYSDSLDKIDQQRFAEETQKRKDKLTLFSGYIKDVQTLKAEQKKEEAELRKEAAEAAEKARDWSYKLSGLMGTVYVPGSDGNPIDTGIATFEAKKFDVQDQRDLMRIQISSQAERRQTASDLITNYGSAAAPYVESLMGLPSGSLSGYKTKDELNRAFDAIKESNDMYKWQYEQDQLDKNGESLTTYEQSGKTINKNGIGIDPFSLPDVRENIANSSVVQKSSKIKGGTEMVFRDGYVHALRGGTVVDLIPWDGVSPWGNQAIIQDETGAYWQYSNLGDRKTGKNPFSVQIGDQIDAMSAIGLQGNTGMVASSSNPNDPAYGVHTDIRIVGKQNLNGTIEQAEAWQLGETVSKLLVKAGLSPGEHGGQCGTFTRLQAGVRVGDSYASKQAVVNANPLKQPVPGAVFVMPVSGGSAQYGHIGIVDSVGQDQGGKYIMACDSNWSNSNDERVRIHKIYTDKIYGFTPPKGGYALEVFNKSKGLHMPSVPELATNIANFLGVIPATAPPKLSVDVLTNAYFEAFGEEPNESDLKTLETRGYKGLSTMIADRNKVKPPDKKLSVNDISAFQQRYGFLPSTEDRNMLLQFGEEAYPLLDQEYSEQLEAMQNPEEPKPWYNPF